MIKDNDNLKVFSMRMPKETWMFLKKTSADQEISMAEIIMRCVEKYKKKFYNKSIENDINL